MLVPVVTVTATQTSRWRIWWRQFRRRWSADGAAALQRSQNAARLQAALKEVQAIVEKREREK